MKNIKTTFDSFLNEELSPQTYMDTADKLHNMGHRNRAEKLREHGKNVIQKEEETATNNINNELSKINPVIITCGDEEFEIKPEYFTFTVFNKIDDESEHGSIVIDWELPKEKLLDEDDYVGQNIFFPVDFDINEVLDGPNIDGLLLDDRKNANKIVKMIKDIINIKVGEQPELELILPYLKVNDFYQD